MKILLSGASGLLGSALLKSMDGLGWRSTPFSRQLSWDCSNAELAQTMIGYDWFIHAAANTNVEQCEVNSDDCYRDNYLLTERLAQAAEMAGLRFVFVSSTGVYGTASDQPYAEYHPAQPTTHHHRSKLLAEQAVAQICARSLIIRTGWLFGGNPANPKNFVARRIDEARAALKNGVVVQSNAEQRGVPCYVADVAQRMLLLIQLDYAGLFNCVNSGAASRFEYVQAIISAAGIEMTVQATTAGSFNRRAKVSNNEMALNWKMENLQLATMPDWRASLQHYIKSELTQNLLPE